MKNLANANVSRPVLLTVLISLAIVVAPFWLVTRDLFDGASVRFAFETGMSDGLYDWLLAANWVVGVFFFKFSFALSNLMSVDYQLIIKIHLTLLIFLVYYEFYNLGVDFFGLSRSQSLLMANVCLASPCLYAFVNSAAIPIFLCIWLMLIGHRLYRYPLLRFQVIGWLLIVVSFQLNSNLVMVLALDLVYLSKYRSQWRSRWIGFAILACTAVLTFGAIKSLAAPVNLFVEYNRLLNIFDFNDARRMVRAVAMYGTWIVVPTFVLAFVYITIFILQKTSISHGSTNSDVGTNNEFGWKASLFLCGAAIFPYVMVGKGYPLFTVVGFGNGLTEQVLRATYEGPFAPTWASTSSRHGLLFSLTMAMLSFFVAQALVARSQLARTEIGALLGYFAAVIPMLSFALPAVYNKLEMQHAEISLVKALAKHTPAPAGVVEVHYRPASDWLIWGNAGTEILREAWSRSHYYTMMHSVPAYKLDLMWGYNVYFKGSGGLGSSLVQHSLAMDKYPGEACYTQYQASLPQVGFWGTALAGIQPSRVQPAKVELLQSDCRPDRQLINPLPEKKFIP